ncbi:hypothetical protein ACFW3Z_02210 [Nocardiopsis alba]|uniref:hypothetical protein n=1 Tax=Nocardiopsis alba TaxID=53437 RepID=UPI0033AD97C6
MAEGTVARATARMIERRHVTRSGVTRVSLIASVAAAVWFSRADPTGAVIGSLFLALILACDAVRSRMRSDRRDALTLWTVSMASQLREYVVYVGLAFGAAAAGHASAWGWAAGALIALALRNALLVAFAAPPASSATPALFVPAQRRSEAVRPPGVPRPRPAGVPEPSLPLPLLIRRVMAFGQPTRFLVIAVATTLWDARIAFVSLIVGCAVAITGELVDPSSRGEGR